MKQKYHIWKNIKGKELVIREYAVLSGSRRRKDFQRIQEDEFSLLSEQIYDAGAVKKSISEGKSSLILLLRTRHFYPIGLCMAKIADTVVTMFAAKGEQSENIIFDDKEFIYEEQIEQEIAEEIEDEADPDSPDDLDGLLKDDIKIKESVSPDNPDHEPFNEGKS